ncbi:VOC family protein [Marinobacter mangrovi]|uniref:VOC family protein n=1 Tax=Marinobacter mangrovi TaxID=2803918 RepID=UPI001931A408|nr:VOC family protein [Marinobacter mangrovi]
MDIKQTGMILNTERFDACVAFYRDLFELPLQFEKQEGDFRLACLDFGGSYLMIETGGWAQPAGKPIEGGAVKLRFNVSDLDAALAKVRAYGIDARIESHPWGSTINLFDPDGNRVGIRDGGRFGQAQ